MLRFISTTHQRGLYQETCLFIIHMCTKLHKMLIWFRSMLIVKKTICFFITESFLKLWATAQYSRQLGRTKCTVSWRNLDHGPHHILVAFCVAYNSNWELLGCSPVCSSSISTRCSLPLSVQHSVETPSVSPSIHLSFSFSAQYNTSLTTTLCRVLLSRRLG